MKPWTVIVAIIIVFYIIQPKTSAPNASSSTSVKIASQASTSAEPDQAQKIAAEAAEEARCRDDLRCTAEKFEIDARIRCGHEIEQRAKYDFKWMDPGWFGAYGQIFESYSWANRPARIVNYNGDKV